MDYRKFIGTTNAGIIPLTFALGYINLKRSGYLALNYLLIFDFSAIKAF
tara:strand:+ start:287 stop:433 length:147 start_codon:yes stop_codon:yes gene_type:complete